MSTNPEQRGNTRSATEQPPRCDDDPTDDTAQTARMEDDKVDVDRRSISQHPCAVCRRHAHLRTGQRVMFARRERPARFPPDVESASRVEIVTVHNRSRK
jgi:hypothetical protein